MRKNKKWWILQKFPERRGQKKRRAFALLFMIGSYTLPWPPYNYGRTPESRPPTDTPCR